MKNKVLILLIVEILIVMLLVLTGCNSIENSTVSNVIENTSIENVEATNNSVPSNISEQQDLKVGENTLKYGSYKGSESIFVEGEGMITSEITIEINKDGTFKINSSNTKVVGNSSGLYKIEQAANYPGIVNQNEVLNLGGGIYIVPTDNTIEAPAGSGTKFVYTIE